MPLTIVSAGNPIIVTGTTSASQVVLNKGRPIFVRFVYWYAPSTAGHLVNLIDGKGDSILPMYCDTANRSQVWPVYTSFDSIYCDDMDSGELRIFIG